MQKRKVPVLVAAVLVVILFDRSEVNAIECYECNGNENSTCANENVPTEFITDCAAKKGGSTYTFCRKTVQEINMKVNGSPDRRIIRGCGYIEERNKKECYEKHSFQGYQLICTCSDNKCNSASGVKTFPLLFLGLICHLSVI